MTTDGIDYSCQKQRICFLLLLSFNMRIPTLLSPVTEDLDWNGGVSGNCSLQTGMESMDRRDYF
jgi:hypothetical protein